jgi:hypothetical protein
MELTPIRTFLEQNNIWWWSFARQPRLRSIPTFVRLRDRNPQNAPCPGPEAENSRGSKTIALRRATVNNADAGVCLRADDVASMASEPHGLF